MSSEHRSRSTSTPGRDPTSSSSSTGQHDKSTSTTRTELATRSITKKDPSALVTVWADPRPTLSRRVLDIICFPVARRPKSSRARSVSAPTPPVSTTDAKTTDAPATNDAPSTYVTFPAPTFHTGGQPRAFDSRIPSPDNVPLPPASHPFWIDHPPVPRHLASSHARRLQHSRRRSSAERRDG